MGIRIIGLDVFGFFWLGAFIFFGMVLFRFIYFIFLKWFLKNIDFSVSVIFGGGTFKVSVGYRYFRCFVFFLVLWWD